MVVYVVGGEVWRAADVEFGHELSLGLVFAYLARLGLSGVVGWSIG